MIDAIEGTHGYSEPRLSSALAQVTSRRFFDGLIDESASPWAAVSLAAALFVSCFHTGGIRRLISFRDRWCEADLSTVTRRSLSAIGCTLSPSRYPPSTNFQGLLDQCQSWLVLSRLFFDEALELRIIVKTDEVVIAGGPVRIMVARLDRLLEGGQGFGFHVQIPVGASRVIKRERVVPAHRHRLFYFRCRLARPANRRVSVGQQDMRSGIFRHGLQLTLQK